jgi:beta-1,4-N-acetylglucosaminyltransferase
MDEIAGKIDEKVIMQIGNTKYKPVNAEYFEFAEYSKIQKLNSDARIVVSHAGVGSILTALEQKTHLIIFPSIKKI